MTRGTWRCELRDASCRWFGAATDCEIPLESPFAKVGVGDRVQGEVLPGV
jgi:hypothetical protein